MDAQMKANLQTIEDMVINEDKIVTYKGLSSILKVHANTAKQLLFAFSKSENNIGKLFVLYTITGFLKESDEYHIALVSEEQLDEEKKSFKSITSEHVYCVQKRPPSGKPRNFSIADSEWINNRFSAISISKDNVRSTSSHNSMQEKVMETSKQDMRSESNEINWNKICKKEPPTELPALKVQETNVERKQTTPSPKKDKKTVKKNSVSKGAGISVFFNKQVSKPDVKSMNESKTETKKTQEKHPIDEVENIIVNKTPSPKKLRLEKEAQSKDPKPKNKNVKTKDKKKKRVKSESKEEERKRKRIKVFSDSESSEEEESRMDEDPPPEEPPSVPRDDVDDEVIPPTPVEKGKKRVRKEVDRTFADEDGFLVTKKEYVYEETEDNSNDAVMTKGAEENKTSIERKKESPKAAMKPSPTKNKQASITNFFKRK